MISSRALLRPFSMWNIEPYSDEPAHGYFGRLVAEEEHGSSRVYANEIGVNGRDIVPSEQLEVILQLPIPKSWRDRLQYSTAVIHEAGVRLCGETLRDKQFSISKRRFCPACLGENAYHRLWWDILAIAECPFHRMRIEDSLPDGSPLKWWWPHFDHSPKGEYLGQKNVPRQQPVGTFAGYILSRLGLCEPSPARLLDDMSLSEVIDACDMLGRLLGSPMSAHSPPSSESHPEVGFQALSQSPAHLVRQLRNWLAGEVPENFRRRGHVVAFGWLADNRHALSKQISNLFGKAMKKAMTAENRAVHRDVTDADLEAEDIGIEALAQELGIVRRGVAAIADRLGILPEREWYRARVHFDPGEAALIREFMNDVVTTQEATAILGLPKNQLAPLINAGFLDRLTGVSAGNSGSRYMKSQAEMLQAQVVAGIRVGKVKGSCSLWISARHMKLTPGELAVRILAREIVPICRLPGVVGFMSLRFMNPGGVTFEQRRPRALPLDAINRIGEIALSDPDIGLRRMCMKLAEEGIRISEPSLRLHMINLGVRTKADRLQVRNRAFNDGD